AVTQVTHIFSSNYNPSSTHNPASEFIRIVRIDPNWSQTYRATIVPLKGGRIRWGRVLSAAALKDSDPFVVFGCGVGVHAHIPHAAARLPASGNLRLSQWPRTKP